MRWTLWFSMGFAMACGLGAYVLPSLWGLPLAGGCLILSLVLYKCEAGKTALIALGLALGLGWFLLFQRFYLVPAQAMDGTELETTVTAMDYSWETDYGQAVDGKFIQEGKTYKIRLYVNTSEPIAPGDTLTGTFRLRYTAPGAKRETTHHAGEKILFLGYESKLVEHRLRTQKTLIHWAVELSGALKYRLEELFPGDVFPFVQGLLLGATSALDYETETALSISGIRHIVAVSGLHVAILYSLIRNLTFRKRWLTALLGFPALVLFCAVSGFRPSATRSCIMVGLMMASQLCKREYDPPTGLAVAVLVMLVENPLVITSIAFQMSVGCVASILLFQKPVSQWLVGKLGDTRGASLKARLRRWFISSVSVSVSATVFTAPLSAYYFGTVSLVGVLTNLLTLWVVEIIFIGILLACVMSLVWMPGAAALAWLLAWPVRYVLLAAKILSNFPLAAVYTKSVYIVLWLIFVYILLAVFLLSRNRDPLLLGCCAALGLCAALLLSWTEYRRHETHMTVLDVGQGQSIILHQNGKTFLIDCGGTGNPEIYADMATQTLLSRGITRLDGIILTHTDLDHAGAVPELLTQIPADWIMVPATGAREVLAQIEAQAPGTVISVAEDMRITLDGGEITVFGPIFASDANENSLCILFESEKCAILVTGDRGTLGEAMLLQEFSLPQVDVLIAGHHGSKHSTSQALLEAVRPRQVIISVDANNHYGHPAPEVLERLKAFGCRVFRTDLHGTIIFRR